MKYQNVFKLMFAEFSKARIPFLLVGGFAVNAHRVSRSTQDIDFLIAEGNYSKARSILAEGGYKEIEKENVCARFKSDELFFIDLDLLLTDEKTLNEMLKEAKEVEVRGEKFLVPSIKHLIAMKLHSLKNTQGHRDYKDMLDIMELLRKNKIDINSEDFRSLCMKFASEELYFRIKEGRLR